MWALIHLGSSEVIYTHEYKFNVREYLKKYYFYRDVDTGIFEVRSNPPEQRVLTTVEVVNGQWTRTEKRNLISLNRCEFIVTEVSNVEINTSSNVHGCVL